MCGICGFLNYDRAVAPSELAIVKKMNEKLHIPLLLSQYGYSTYKGS